MDFLTDVTEKIAKSARTATKKSEDLVEITKLNLAIGNEEDRMKKIFYEIGCEIYKDYINRKVQSELYNNRCTEIKQIEDNIKALKEKILLHKGSKPCRSCGAIVGLDVNYCPNCGMKLKKAE